MCLRTNVPPLQPPHVYVPVEPAQHHECEHHYAQNTQEAHHHSKYHVEEEQKIGQKLIQPPEHTHTDTNRHTHMQKVYRAVCISD